MEEGGAIGTALPSLPSLSFLLALVLSHLAHGTGTKIEAPPSLGLREPKQKHWELSEL